MPDVIIIVDLKGVRKGKYPRGLTLSRLQWKVSYSLHLPLQHRELIRDFFFHLNCHEVILQEVTTIFCPCTGNRSAASGPGSVAPECTDQSSGLLQYTCFIVSKA